MEETANLLEKGENFVLKNIEKRLGNLESTMQEVLARGDQFNEETCIWVRITFLNHEKVHANLGLVII